MIKILLIISIHYSVVFVLEPAHAAEKFQKIQMAAEEACAGSIVHHMNVVQKPFVVR